MEAEFRMVINEERSAERTVLLSSHVLSEVEALCDRVSIIREGRTIESGTLAQLRHLTRTSIEAEITGNPSDLSVLSGMHALRVDDHRVSFEVDADHLGAALAQLSQLGVNSLVSHPPTLEELFLRHYRQDPPHS
jgi:ABC-2 type transport system ATP-binding protein